MGILREQQHKPGRGRGCRSGVGSQTQVSRFSLGRPASTCVEVKPNGFLLPF